MANLRILHDNAANRVSSLSASTTSGSLAAANLLTDRKAEVHRATATSVTYTATWASPELMSMVALAFTNYTSTATIRVRAYTLAADASPAVDTGAVLACGYSPLGLWPWGTVPLGVNAFSYGGGTYGRAYFTAGAYEKLVIDIVDVDQPLSYVEASRLIVGAYWSPEYNAAYGATARVNDTTANTRSQSGDLRSDVGTVSRSLSINLEWIAEADRPRLWNILRGSAKSGPVFISLFPEDADPELEQAHQIYGKLASDLAISHPMFGIFSGPLEVEEN